MVGRAGSRRMTFNVGIELDKSSRTDRLHPCESLDQTLRSIERGVKAKQILTRDASK